MITTRTHILSGTQSAFTSGGVQIYESGPTNLVISFSGTDVTSPYLKFLVKYDDDSSVYTVTSPTTAVDDIRTQSISRHFEPSVSSVTSYMIDVSGVKNTLDVDNYRINLRLGHRPSNTYKDLKIINTNLYTSDEGANYLFVTLEGESPRYVGNVVIPFSKDPSVYLPPQPVVFVPNDNKVLRIEVFSQLGSYVPIVLENSGDNLIDEDQYVIHAIGTEGG